MPYFFCTLVPPPSGTLPPLTRAWPPNMRLRLDQDHRRAGFLRDDRRRQPAGARTDDDDVGLAMPLVGGCCACADAGETRPPVANAAAVVPPRRSRSRLFTVIAFLPLLIFIDCGERVARRRSRISASERVCRGSKGLQMRQASSWMPYDRCAPQGDIGRNDLAIVGPAFQDRNEKEGCHAGTAIRSRRSGSRQHRQHRPRERLHHRPAPGDPLLRHRPWPHARSLSQHGLRNMWINVGMAHSTCRWASPTCCAGSPGWSCRTAPHCSIG